MQKCVAISNKNAILEKNDEKRKDIKDFLEPFDVDWSVLVSNKALATLYNAKFNIKKTTSSIGRYYETGQVHRKRKEGLY